MTDVPSHLGGSLQHTWTDPGVLAWAKDLLDVRSMVDVGCGPCGMAQIAHDLKIKWFGIDRDPELQPAIEKNGGLLWDFKLGPPPLSREFDLGWCVEFLEHIEERYLDNFMAVLKHCRYVVCTAAPPGSPWHHHVNMKPAEYWHQVFLGHGLEYAPGLTAEMKHHSTMRATRGASLMTNTGMFYQRQEPRA